MFGIDVVGPTLAGASTSTFARGRRSSRDVSQGERETGRDFYWGSFRFAEVWRRAELEIFTGRKGDAEDPERREGDVAVSAAGRRARRGHAIMTSPIRMSSADSITRSHGALDARAGSHDACGQRSVALPDLWILRVSPSPCEIVPGDQHPALKSRDEAQTPSLLVSLSPCESLSRPTASRRGRDGEASETRWRSASDEVSTTVMAND